MKTPAFPVDTIIVSANENWLYLDFWPFVAWAYRTLFPGVRVVLTFVSERREDDPFVAQLRWHGEVVLVQPVRGIPQAAQCKMARFWYAAQQGDAVCYVDDADVIPIDREWYAAKVRKRKQGTLLLIGQEVYGAPEEGQAPASMMTGEGRIFRQLFNPNDLPFDAYMKSLSGREGRHSDIYSRANHEGMFGTTDERRIGQYLFSDEALIVRLRAERPVPVTLEDRGYDTATETVDRSYWSAFDRGKLDSGGYLTAHTGRPYAEHKEGNDAIFAHLARRYGGAVPPALVKAPTVDPDMTFFEPSGIYREAFEWICRNVSTRRSILEIGSGHVSTNYLTRYYEVRSIEHDPYYVNLYPSHYIYAPLAGDWYDVELIRLGFSSYNTYRPLGLILVDGGAPPAGILDHADIFDFSVPILVVGGDDQRVVGADDRLVHGLAARTGRTPNRFASFTVV